MFEHWKGKLLLKTSNLFKDSCIIEADVKQKNINVICGNNWRKTHLKIRAVAMMFKIMLFFEKIFPWDERWTNIDK